MIPHVLLKLQNGSSSGLVHYTFKDGVFQRNDDRQIVYDEPTDTFRFTKNGGFWKTFNGDGQLIEYGTRNGTTARLNYTDGVLTGISDRNDTQVISYTYGDGEISIEDYTGRTVVYEVAYKGVFENKLIINKVRKYPDGASGDVVVTDYNYSLEERSFTLGKDGSGNIEILNYEEARLTSKTLPGGKEAFIFYRDDGYVSRIEDESGVGQSFSYDYDKETQTYSANVQSDNGMTKRVTYTSEGNPKDVTTGGQPDHSYGKSGRTKIFTDVKGNVTKRVYDEFHNLVKKIDPDGTSIEVKYLPGTSKPVWIKSKRGVVSTFEYSPAGNLVTKTLAKGTPSEQTFTYTWDGSHQMLSETFAGDENTPSATTSFTWDSFGNIATITGPEGGVTRFNSYTASGQPEEIVDARGNQTTYVYDALGRPVSETNALGQTSTIEYDSGNRPVKLPMLQATT